MAFLFLIILELGLALFIDLPTSVFSLFVYIVLYCLAGIGNKYLRTKRQSITSWLYIAASTYILICYSYMQIHGYEYLLVYDTVHVYIPRVKQLLTCSSYLNAIEEIWTNFNNLFLEQSNGYYTYAVGIGFIGKFFGANTYIVQQYAITICYCLSGLVIFAILNKLNRNSTYNFKWSLIISLISIIFYYSTLILRDTPIMLLYLIGIYITIKGKFNLCNIGLLLLLSIICCTFRIESGLFLFSFIALLFFTSSYQFTVVKLVSTFSLIILFSFFYTYYAGVLEVFDNNYNNYSEGVSSGTGIIGQLQRIPIIGWVMSIIYTAIQPVPAWSKMITTSSSEFGGEVYNIMNFPRIFASFFNLYILAIIAKYLTTKKLRISVNQSLTLGFKYQLFWGLLFLLLQSAVVTQRRLMAYYCVFYILGSLIVYHCDQKSIRLTFVVSFVLFIILQIFGILFLQ